MVYHGGTRAQMCRVYGICRNIITWKALFAVGFFCLFVCFPQNMDETLAAVFSESEILTNTNTVALELPQTLSELNAFFSSGATCVF